MSSSFRYFVLFLMLLSPALSYSQTSSEYAEMAMITWVSFECSALAEQSDNKAEHERLFNLGYEKGKIFISALQSGKVKQEDFSKKSPMILGMLLAGPTPDFMLGRIFENAIENALKDVFTTAGNYNSENDQALIAKRKYSEKNCSLIGK